MSESAYKELVLADYDEKVKRKQLPSELLLPTPANIKSELVKAFGRGFDPDDEKILRSFVGPKPDMAAYRNAIQIGKADPFRPLVNLLRDSSIDTNQRNVDLLALLIDFKPRPFHFNLVLEPKPFLPNEIQDPSLQINPPVEIKEEPAATKDRTRKPLFIFASVISLIIIGFIAIQLYRQHLATSYGCMIWDDNHYEPVDCRDHSLKTAPLPVDHQLVDHFKRITKPETLTVYSVRKVWYAKYRGRVEFYTDSGIYPLDTSRRLLPMTATIWQKYVLHAIN